MSKTASRYDLPDLPGVPVMHLAAALRVLGIKVSVTTESVATSAGRTISRWYATTEPGLARALVLGRALKSPADQRRAACFRAAMDALDACRSLHLWLTQGRPFYADKPMLSISTDPTVPHSATPAAMLKFSAAAIAVGHLPRPDLQSVNGERMPSLLYTAAGGTTLADLAAAECELRARRKPGHVASKAITLTGAEPEEHPFVYAREAIEHLELCQRDLAASARNPTGLFTGRGGRSAAVSHLLLQDPRKEAILEQHLAGTL